MLRRMFRVSRTSPSDEPQRLQFFLRQQKKKKKTCKLIVFIRAVPNKFALEIQRGNDKVS